MPNKNPTRSFSSDFGGLSRAKSTLYDHRSFRDPSNGSDKAKRQEDKFEAKSNQMDPLPQTQTCLSQPADGGGPPIISKSHPMPEIKEPYDVLIRVSTVALNPTDYKMPEYHPVPNAIMGCDFMGTVVSAGLKVNNALPGTRLCGSLHGSNPGNPNSGSFAEYLVVDARLCLRVPDTWSDLEGAALGGVGWTTVALAIEHSLHLTGTPSKPAPLRIDGSRVPVLVYGGATATGTMACQILARCVQY